MELDKEERIPPENPAAFSTIIGEKVKIKSITKESMGPEDYYYLKKFENKTGTICEQNECNSGVCNYKVEFDKQVFGYFYKKDFTFINEH